MTPSPLPEGIVDPWAEKTPAKPAKPSLSPVRQWLIKELETLFPPGSNKAIRSDNDAALFQLWTGTNHSTLTASWAKQAKAKADMARLTAENKVAEITQEMRLTAAATLTSCNSFLGVVSQRTCNAGGLSGPKLYNSFDLPVAGNEKNGNSSWHWWPAADGAEPRPGDFFQMGTRGGTYLHVGIIYAIDLKTNTWTVVEGGQGGPRQQPPHDKIMRNGPGAFPPPVKEGKPFMGWIDIDAFFQGWNGDRGVTSV